MKLLDEGAADEAMSIAADLASSHDEAERLAGTLCKGHILEAGGRGVPRELNLALEHYRRAAVSVPSALSYLNMARTYLKMDDFVSARRFLDEAATIETTPEVLLGFAEYFRKGPHKDLAMSRAFFAKAAIRGRFNGFFGYSEVAREEGNSMRAALADCLRLVLGPLIFLAIGSRAQDRF